MSNALCCRKWIDFAYKSSESLEYVKYSPEYFEYEESLKYALSRVTRDVNREFLSLFFLFIYSFSEESNNDIRVLRANNLFIIFPRRVLFVYNIRTTQAFFFFSGVSSTIDGRFISTTQISDLSQHLCIRALILLLL